MKLRIKRVTNALGEHRYLIQRRWFGLFWFTRLVGDDLITHWAVYDNQHEAEFAAEWMLEAYLKECRQREQSRRRRRKASSKIIWKSF